MSKMRRPAAYVMSWALMSAVVIVPPELTPLDWRVWVALLVALVAIQACRDW